MGEEVMTERSHSEYLQSVAAIQSAILKTERALTQMCEKGRNITLISKRLAALHLGLAILTEDSDLLPDKYRSEDFQETRKMLMGLLSSIDRIYNRLKPGSPQHTLLTRRRAAIQTIIENIVKICSTQ